MTDQNISAIFKLLKAGRQSQCTTPLNINNWPINVFHILTKLFHWIRLVELYYFAISLTVHAKQMLDQIDLMLNFHAWNVPNGKQKGVGWTFRNDFVEVLKPFQSKRNCLFNYYLKQMHSYTRLVLLYSMKQIDWGISFSTWVTGLHYIITYADCKKILPEIIASVTGPYGFFTDISQSRGY
jgi:hypothetical protein